MGEVNTANYAQGYNRGVVVSKDAFEGLHPVDSSVVHTGDISLRLDKAVAFLL